MADPRITDNDAGEITATVNGKEVRGWSYSTSAEQMQKMRMAHEFAEGWFQASVVLGTRLREVVVLMENDIEIGRFNGTVSPTREMVLKQARELVPRRPK